MLAHPGKQLLVMGQEFGQLSEWSEERGLDWWILDQPSHKQLAEFVGALNRTYRGTPALWQLDVADLDLSGGHVEDAFDRLLTLFPKLDADGKKRVRERIVELFEVVGTEDPRVTAARRRLTNLLF